MLFRAKDKKVLHPVVKVNAKLAKSKLNRKNIEQGKQRPSYCDVRQWTMLLEIEFYHPTEKIGRDIEDNFSENDDLREKRMKRLVEGE